MERYLGYFPHWWVQVYWVFPCLVLCWGVGWEQWDLIFLTFLGPGLWAGLNTVADDGYDLPRASPVLILSSGSLACPLASVSLSPRAPQARG